MGQMGRNMVQVSDAEYCGSTVGLDGMSEDRIIVGKARFSSLGDGLVRMEYAPDGWFEDRPSFRALARPAAGPFAAVTREGEWTCLKNRRMTVRYRADGQPFSSANLQVMDSASDRLVWTPGQVDNENLGGVHLSMDCVQRRVIPQGVHPATTDYHENSSRWQLWSYMFNPDGSTEPDAHYNGEARSLEQLLAMRPLESFQPRVQELIRERSKYPPGLLSRAGYFLFNDSNSPVLDSKTGWIEDRGAPDALDYYLFVYGRDFAGALRDYRRLFGASPLVPRYSLGLWYSRYPTFNEPQLRELIHEFDKQDLPLDVLVLDLEWHQRGWFGYDWDTSHIHDPGGFLKFLRKQGIHTTLNLHPSGIPVEDSRFGKFIETAGVEVNPKRMNPNLPVFHGYEFGVRRQAEAYMNVMLKPVEQQGVDFWWMDGDVPCPSVKVDSQFWTNHVFQQHIDRELPDRRSMVFSRSAGLGSHRYPFHFTGDTYCQWEVLRSQVEYTLRAGHIGQSFITHDIGGHICEHRLMDPELYSRWVQFGVLSPVVRLHSSGGGERLPWLYGEKVMKSFQTALRFRMELLPYFYTLAQESSETCMPICRSNGLAQPDWEPGYEIWDSYYLGDRIYATPITAPGTHRQVVLPPGAWYCGRSGERIESDGKTAFPIVAGVHEKPPHYIRAGVLLVKQSYQHRAARLPDTLTIEIYVDNAVNNTFELYEDDGLSRAHDRGAFARTRFTVTGTPDRLKLEVGAAGGAFEGQPLARAFEIRVIGAREPRSVRTPEWPVHTAQTIEF